MKNIVPVWDSPDQWPDRACKQYPLDTFAPDESDRAGVAAAIKVCVGGPKTSPCPRLSRCAKWAGPLVEQTALIECVVAGVYVPRPRDKSKRAAAVAALARVATSAAAEEAA